MATPLFDASLLPSSLTTTLPSGLTLRPLSSTDYTHSHLSLLSHLTSSPDIGHSAWSTRFQELLSINQVHLTYLCVVIEEASSNELVGSATLVVERKFLRSAGMVGHVEDVVVHPRMQGKKLGVSLLKVLTQLSEDLGCYKVRSSPFYALSLMRYNAEVEEAA